MAETGDVLVVGSDGSSASDRALEWALQEARRRGALVEVLTVYGRIQHGWTLGEQTPARRPREVAEHVQAEQVTRVAEPYRDGVALTVHLLDGRPVERLVEASRHATLLVLGSHGAGLLHQAFVGSVAAGCIRASHCPVVVLPAFQGVGVEQREADRWGRYHPGPMY